MSAHDGTAHADSPDHFRLTCSCGWELDPAPNNWDRWADLLNEHRAEAAREDEEPRRCTECGAVCDMRVQACECGPSCPLPPVVR